MIDFKGKVALVTGGGSGIGAAISRKLAAAGASVVVSDVRLDAAKQVADDIDLVLFLPSENATFVTGSYHLVDGGHSAR